MTTTRGIRGLLLSGALALGACWHPGGDDTTPAAQNASLGVTSSVAAADLPDAPGCDRLAGAALSAARVDKVRGVHDLYLVRSDDGLSCLDTQSGIQTYLGIALDLASSDPMPGIDPAASDPMPGSDNSDPASSDPMPGQTSHTTQTK